MRQERSRPLIVELELTHNTKDNFIPGQFHTSQTKTFQTKTISYQDNFIPRQFHIDHTVQCQLESARHLVRARAERR